MTTEHSRSYTARWQEREVDQRLVTMVPPFALQFVSEVMALSILRAHDENGARWGLTAQPDFFRLNVGPAEAVFIDEHGLRVMVDVPTLRAAGEEDVLARLSHTPPNRFKSVPDASYVTLPYRHGLDYLRTAIGLLIPAHDEHLALAARSGLNGMTKRGHHPRAVAVIGVAAGRGSLPQPTYMTVPRPAGLSIDLGVADVSDDATAPAAAAFEGDRSTVTLEVPERDRQLRAACLAHYGVRCVACGFAMEEVYGPAAAGLIHVHHLHPVADGERLTDAIRDLRPVCPNCHLVIHACKPMRSIEEVQAMRRAARAHGHA